MLCIAPDKNPHKLWCGRKSIHDGQREYQTFGNGYWIPAGVSKGNVIRSGIEGQKNFFKTRKIKIVKRQQRCFLCCLFTIDY